MKVQIHIEDINETVEGPDAAGVLHLVKCEAARRAPFLLRGVINAMSDLTFAAEAVKRANSANGCSDAIPKSAQEFLDWTTMRGYATILQA